MGYGTLTRVINLFAGPGAGKSTTAAGLFFLMKSNGYKVELVTERAKELVYEEDFEALNDQIAVTREQDRRQRRLLCKVDWIITDSPLILAEVYVQGPDAYREFCSSIAWQLYHGYTNVNCFICRTKSYQEFGRTQTEQEARAIDERLQDLTAGMIHVVAPGNTYGVRSIFEHIKSLPQVQ